ncbi:hypothetical protein MVEG_09582 [Podila verticillata NRRL 6337]|nr:hypothetical protein MVEG_09582 [Podila verticillata NRRL 6337]
MPMDTLANESDRYRDPVVSRNSTRHPPEASSGNNNNNYNNNNSSNRYSLGDESGSDTTAMQSHSSLERTDSFTKHRRVSESNSRSGGAGGGGSFDPDNVLQNGSSHRRHGLDYGDDGDDESDVDLDFGFTAQDYDSSTKVPLVSYKTKTKSSKAQKQQKRQGGYGRISNDSLRSGTSLSMDDDDEHHLNFGQEEEEVGMMTGNRTNRSGIGNHGHGHGHDPVEAKLPDHGGSLFNSFLNMANSIIGAGIIGLPFAFQEAGLGMGIILLCALTWIVDWTVGLLVHNAKLSGRNTYQDLLMFCFGKTGLIVISIFQFVFAFGAMCAYTVIVGDTLPHVLQALIPGIETWPILGVVARRSFVITFFTVAISFPLSLYRDISKLAKTSAIAMLALVVIIIAVVIEGPRAPMELRGDPDAVWSFARPELFQSIGVISFAFVCHHNSFLIFGALQKPTMNRVKIVTHMSMAVSLFACLVLALSGFLAFSDKTQGNILNNFPSDNFIINIARFCFGVNMFTTLPLENFVCREVIETYYFAGQPFSMKRHVIITTGLVGSALVIALLTCDLGFVLEMTGGFSATALAFILPPLCYLKLASGPVWCKRKIPHMACLGFGVAVMILSTLFSLQHFMAPKDAASQCSM